MNKFANRCEAGRMLAEHLKDYANQNDVIVLALPRGGVPVAYEVAKMLHAPLDVFIVRKLGAPGFEELAMGAIAPGDIVVFKKKLLKTLNVSQKALEPVIEAEKQELERREHEYRANRPFPSLYKKQVILVDDGIATGATMEAAIYAIRQHQPKAVIVAVPVAAASTCADMLSITDKIVCVLTPENFYAVGNWYKDFSQTTDKEVQDLLSKANTT